MGKRFLAGNFNPNDYINLSESAIWPEMKDKIQARIIKLFESTLKKIDEQSNCDHDWKDKDGAAYFRCKICGYNAEDRILDKLIFTKKLLDKGMTHKMLKDLKDYI